MELETKKISSRELTPRQRRKVRRLVRWYRERNAYSGVTSVRFELYTYEDYCRLAWITLKTWRSDCGKYSPRAIVCEQYLHAMIGPRGGLTIHTARNGISRSEKTHVRKMLS